jgi:hypothetical protein
MLQGSWRCPSAGSTARRLADEAINKLVMTAKENNRGDLSDLRVVLQHGYR